MYPPCRAIIHPDIFGQPGIDTAFRIIELGKEVYKHVEPTRVGGKIIIFHRITEQQSTSDYGPSSPGDDFSLFANTSANLTIEVTGEARA